MLQDEVMDRGRGDHGGYEVSGLVAVGKSQWFFGMEYERLNALSDSGKSMARQVENEGVGFSCAKYRFGTIRRELELVLAPP